MVKTYPNGESIIKLLNNWRTGKFRLLRASHLRVEHEMKTRDYRFRVAWQKRHWLIVAKYIFGARKIGDLYIFGAREAANPRQVHIATLANPALPDFEVCT